MVSYYLKTQQEILLIPCVCLQTRMLVCVCLPLCSLCVCWCMSVHNMCVVCTQHKHASVQVCGCVIISCSCSCIAWTHGRQPNSLCIYKEYHINNRHPLTMLQQNVHLQKLAVIRISSNNFVSVKLTMRLLSKKWVAKVKVEWQKRFRYQV